MKVLQINTERTWRGGERQTWYLLEGLRKADVDTALLCLAGYPLAGKAKALGVPVHEVPSQWRAAVFLARHGGEYDILHAHAAKSQTLAVITKPFHGKQIVYTRRVDFLPRGLTTRLKYRLTDRVVAISTAIRDILGDFGVDGVPVIPSAVGERTLDAERARGLRESLGIGGRKIIATVAALAPHKDPATMASAVGELSRMRKDFVFLHFGEGVLRAEVERKIAELGVEEFYRLLGHHDEVEDFYGIFDVFAMSSEQEGLGSSILDAFLYGVPVVSTDAGGMRECVAGRGLTCPVGDYRCLAQAMDRMLSDDGLRAEFVEKARVYVRESHSLEDMVKSYSLLYESMI